MSFTINGLHAISNMLSDLTEDEYAHVTEEYARGTVEGTR